MAIRFGLDRIEFYLQSHVWDRSIPLLLKRYGTDVIVFRTVEREELATAPGEAPAMEAAYKSVYEIYGDRSISTVKNPDNILINTNNQEFEARVLIPVHSFIPSDSQFAGDFEINWIISQDDLYPGDRFIFLRDDNVVKAFKLLELDTVGATTTIYKKWKVDSVTDGLV
jgi:hypothetical protein